MNLRDCKLYEECKKGPMYFMFGIVLCEHMNCPDFTPKDKWKRLN